MMPKLILVKILIKISVQVYKFLIVVQSPWLLFPPATCSFVNLTALINYYFNNYKLKQVGPNKIQQLW